MMSQMDDSRGTRRRMNPPAAAVREGLQLLLMHEMNDGSNALLVVRVAAADREVLVVPVVVDPDASGMSRNMCQSGR